MIKKQENKNIIQCCLVGDCKVGKTALVKSFLKEARPETYTSTIFDNFAGNAVCYGEKYTVSLFDNSGLQQYEGLRNFTYKESSVIVVCFSMVDRNSFYNVRDFWIPEIRNCVGSKKAIILVGIHSENTEETASNDVISIEEAHELAKVIRARNFIECSTKDFDAVNEVFEHVAKTAIKLRKLFSIGKFWGK